METLKKSEAAIGVLLLDLSPETRASWDEWPGILTNKKTFDFPVKREVPRGATLERVTQGDLTLIPHFVEAAKKLEQQGVKMIAGECGFMALFQQEMSKAVSIPVVASSLIQVPLVYRMLGENQRVGILTWNAKLLSEKHFNGVGWSSKDFPISVCGVEDIKSWRKDIESWQAGESDWKQMGVDLVKLAKHLVEKSPDVGAIVLECTGFPAHAGSIQKATGLPVFDIITLTRMVFSGSVRI